MPSYDPSGHAVIHQLIEDFAELARHIHASDNFDESLGRITAAAVQAISGCEAASISLIDEDGPQTRGSTNWLAAHGDQIQYEEGEGPCMVAATEQRWIYSPDLSAETRWPRASKRMARELGAASMFSCRLALEAAPNRTRDGLNLYASSPHAFSHQDQMLGILLSSLGAIVVDAARQQQQLRLAIESRQVIGEAIGLLRARSNLSSQQAFALLAKASRRTNTRLRDLARQISDGSRSGGAPLDLD
jgi:hypothetical protein